MCQVRKVIRSGPTTSVVSVLRIVMSYCIEHCAAKSVIFNNSHFWDVFASNLGMVMALVILTYASCLYGFWNMIRFYGIPWMQVNHWIVMITYLHHTDPALPHFRQPAWNFQRGATATIDRDFLGWQGRFFLYDGTDSSITLYSTCLR